MTTTTTTMTAATPMGMTTTTRRASPLTQRAHMQGGKCIVAASSFATTTRRSTAVITRAAYTHTNKKGLSAFVDRVGAAQMKKDLIPFRVGMTLRVGVTVIEGAKTRVQPYEGVVIAIHRSGVASTVTVRKSMQGFGVERVFPIHSPLCTFEEVRGAGKPVVRRAKLFYLRNLVGKQAKLKTRFVAKKEGLSRFEVKMQAMRAEEAAAQAKADAAAAAAAAAEAAAAAAAEAPAAEESA